ncbi:hypothetical protein B7O87_01785 [Cylindrospermopsis raciborskii CENA303]|uniref:Uncharacterized protein n=1 Tax=Cylindrospermopsis raciborskii CENA303 TaxID=1170769 RepID=A0A1X4GIK2_9CYAN|nr:hypothetical protein B7O87_01785 [Cylindrospermopsis raciborskii CENA303]
MAGFAYNFTFWRTLPVDIVLSTSVYSIQNQPTQIKGYYYLGLFRPSLYYFCTIALSKLFGR